MNIEATPLSVAVATPEDHGPEPDMSEPERGLEVELMLPAPGPFLKRGFTRSDITAVYQAASREKRKRQASWSPGTRQPPRLPPATSRCRNHPTAGHRMHRQKPADTPPAKPGYGSFTVPRQASEMTISVSSK